MNNVKFSACCYEWLRFSSHDGLGSYDGLVGNPVFGFWWVAVWVVQLMLAFLVYKDAEKRNKNGILWFVLVFLPWAGIIFLIVYLIIREEKDEMISTLKDVQKILDERYAKGEITREKYLQAKKDISDKIEEENKNED